MATTTSSSIDKISMIGIWAEAVLYGVNCVAYGLAVYTILPGGKIPRLRWALLVMFTTILLLSTAHVVASLQQLLEAFVYAPADVPNYSTTYWLNSATTLRVLKNTLYDTLVLAQDLILIWRLYVVFLYDWRVVVFPIILEVVSIGSALVVSQLIGDPSIGLYGSVVPSLSMIAWILNIFLNVSVTVAIATRLWLMGREVASLTETRVNSQVSTIHIIVESGTMFTTISIAMLALYATNSPASLTGLDLASQLVVLTSLLIIIQVGQTRQRFVSTADPKPEPVALLHSSTSSCSPSFVQDAPSPV